MRNSRHGAFELDAANWSCFFLPGATPDVTQQLLHSPATLLSVPAFAEITSRSSVLFRLIFRIAQMYDFFSTYGWITDKELPLEST